MESKYFKKDALVNILTPKSHLAENKVTILEIQPEGIVGQQKGNKDSPVHFYGWNQIERMTVHQDAAVVGIHRTAGTK